MQKRTAAESSHYLLTIATVLLALAVPASAQSSCTANPGVNVLLRAEGYNDGTGDIVVRCTGGTPTAANLRVPQIDILITLNTTITSRIKPVITNQSTNFYEALLLMDEPNSTKWNNSTPHPLTNCGLHGEDSSFAGPGVCATYSDGNPDDTYDGTVNAQGTTLCNAATDYGCGRPNVFQARETSGLLNTIQFIGIPYDAPGPGEERVMRFVNIRADGTAFGIASPFSTVPVIATISLSNNPWISLSNNTVQVGQAQQGLVSQVRSGTFLQCIATATSTGDPTNPFYSGNGGMRVRILENFPTTFKTKNVTQILANGTLAGTNYGYNGGLNYPADIDQNVPSAVYGTETGFYFPPTGSFAGPGNPPPGFGAPVLGAPGNRFSSNGSGTGIEVAGRADQGSRIAIAFDPPPAGAQMFLPIVVTLQNQGTGGLSGVLVLTDADANGAGPFARSAHASLPPPVDPANNAKWAPLPASNIGVYEVLFSDPNSQEYADIVPALVYDTPGRGVVNASANFGPFYASDGLPSQTLPEPRFGVTGTPSLLYTLSACTTTTTASPALATYSAGSQSVSLNATVTSSAGAVGSGSVTFTVAGVGATSANVIAGAASALLTIPASTAAGSYAISAAYGGAGSFAASSDTSQFLTIQKATPLIFWSNPADITFGSALGGGQLNAIASVPGAFLYSPGYGTVLAAGNGQTLSTTFFPSDSANYNGAGASVMINVVAPPPATPPQLVVTRALSRDPVTGEVVALVTMANTGGSPATNVMLTVARIGSTSTTTALPQALGTINGGTSAQATVRFPASVGASGAATTISLGGSYTGGSFSSTARVTLP